MRRAMWISLQMNHRDRQKGDDDSQWTISDRVKESDEHHFRDTEGGALTFCNTETTAAVTPW